MLNGRDELDSVAFIQTFLRGFYQEWVTLRVEKRVERYKFGPWVGYMQTSRFINDENRMIVLSCIELSKCFVKQIGRLNQDDVTWSHKLSHLVLDKLQLLLCHLHVVTSCNLNHALGKDRSFDVLK